MPFIDELDRKDQFQKGYGIRGGPTLRMRKMPKWMNNKKDIQRLLLRVFPKLETDKRQRKNALRWVEVIRLYFTLGWSAHDVAEELQQRNSDEHVSAKMIYDTAQRIIRAGAGLRTTGKLRVGKRGRPRTYRF
jgi:hypothetical protein